MRYSPSLVIETTTMNNNIMVVRHLVATSLLVMWHSHVIVAVVVGVGDRCGWRPWAMVTTRQWWSLSKGSGEATVDRHCR